jgi:hypothetical protein
MVALRLVHRWLEKMFSTLDQINVKFINSLKQIEGVLCFEDLRRDQIVFTFPLSPLAKKEGILPMVTLLRTCYTIRKLNANPHLIHLS